MTDEMKLLRAFIEASGYEIEEARVALKPIKTHGELMLRSKDKYEINYKVTKKKDNEKI